jgi:signal transduction histidine kinase
MEYRIPGTETWFLMQVRGIKWIDGTLARLHILTDISAIKDRERLREDINRITRHDLKTPLNGILGASQLLLEEEMGDRHRRLVNLIEESGKRMMTIINQSLSLYKMEEGSYELQKDAVSCRLLINTIVDEILNSSEGRGKELRVSDFVCAGESAVAPQGKGSGTSREGICDDVMIQGEYNLCYSILTNLLKNAVEASEKGAAVEVGVRELDGEWVELTVWNGRPIPEEIRATFGSKYTTAGKKYGTGLGVYSARLMTEVQGGRLDWHSDESTGTTLKVILPKYPGSRAEVKRGAETS